MRLSRIAKISVSETDDMTLLEEREFVNLLLKDLKDEKEAQSRIESSR